MSEAERVEGEPATPVKNVVRDSESELASPLVEQKRNRKADQKLLDATDKRQEDEDEVEEWLSKGADPNARSTNSHSTPLHNAARCGHVNIVRTLLSRGADPNAARSHQWTPLHEAANNNEVECIRLLLKKKAALNALNSSHQTPLNLAAAARRGKATNFLLEQAGVDVNIPDDREKTALHNACAAGWANTVKTLLEKGALADTQDDMKKMPIHYAVTASNPRIIKSLLAVGVSVNVQDKSNTTPLHEASARGDANIVEMLITNGASVNVHDTGGKTPLHVASAHNRARVVNILLAHGADINALAHNGCTSLHEALHFGAMHAADTLLAHSAVPSMPLNTQALPGGTQIAVSEPRCSGDLRHGYYDRTKAQEVERKAAGNGMENGGINKKDKTKAENNAESDVETAVLEKIKEYTVDDGGLPSEAESTYLQLMAKLRAAYGHQVDMPVSLDKYFHESIGENELNVRNGDQVISRFIARQRAETDRITTELRSATGATEQGPQHDKSPGELEAGFGDQPQTRAVTDQFCQRILTVPRFWIWKLDRYTVVTSFPQRWDETGRQGCLAREIWMALINKVLGEQKLRKHEIQLDADDLLVEITKTCLQFRPSFRLMGKVYTYPDVFASEVAFVSRQVTSLYRQYRNALGHSVGDFSRPIKLATECLITVEDILSELTMIKRVYRDQGRAMLLLKTADGGQSDAGGSLDYDTANWGYEGLRSTVDKYIIARLKHLEKDAQMITTLLDLRQRQVTIETALSSEVQSDMLFKQSSILFIFTLATVLFAPLSWVAALMALKVNDFTPESKWWSQSRVAGASGGGMSLITSPRMAHVVADSQDSLLSSGIEPEAFYEVEIPGKGSGLIANRTIRKGEIIMQRAPALLIQNHPHIDLEPGLRLEMYQAAVDRLPEPTRTNFLRQTGDTVYEKVEKNSFRVFVDGNTQHSAHLGIFPEVSKFNHDCRPNVHYRISNFTHTTIAVRDIPAGEELTVSYIYGMVPRAERLEQLREWGFTCTCPQCTLSDRESGASDNRIRQIKMLEDEIESLMSAAASNRRRRRQRGSGAEGGGSTENEDVALRPEMGSKLIELYLEERLDAYLTPAYTRAALLYSMFGHEERARNYAREAVGALEREKGPRAGDLPSMRRLAENPRSHWSWGVMVASGEAGGARGKKNQTGGRAVRA
ncbi:hypothetical protein VTI28DRAFT_6462 [Corynascus sepedonium]